MKTLARTLISLIIIYSVGFPLGVAYTKARKLIFPRDYQDLVIHTARKYRLDPLFIAALIHTESSFKPNAVSKSGAVGLMQIMPTTGWELSKKLHLKEFKNEDLFNPKINVELGCFLVYQLSNEFQDRRKVLIAYNAGRGHLKRLSGGDQMLTRAFPETRQYVVKVERVYTLLRLLHGIRAFY